MDLSPCYISDQLSKDTPSTRSFFSFCFVFEPQLALLGNYSWQDFEDLVRYKGIKPELASHKGA